jgi:hypothetical protein
LTSTCVDVRFSRKGFRLVSGAVWGEYCVRRASQVNCVPGAVGRGAPKGAATCNLHARRAPAHGADRPVLAVSLLGAGPMSARALVCPPMTPHAGSMIIQLLTPK